MVQAPINFRRVPGSERHPAPPSVDRHLSATAILPGCGCAAVPPGPGRLPRKSPASRLAEEFFKGGLRHMLLEGKVAIITGAGRGIGRDEALLMAKPGAKAVGNDVRAHF